ncbi:hemagglutinin repeat-containing protein [Glaesserella parasuis]|nr:hemagglutinin repeat-containing protein [Glaesserella parasuis]
MNKNCFRVIFSKTLQCLVVTSELAKSAGKATEKSSFSLSQIFAQIRPLTFSLFCALGFVAFSDTALANLIIQADKSAPKNQQPIVLQTANGLPQVNIQTPNDKGLSHNKYSKFDVDTKGAILNNSRTNVQTQQGGWVQGNPYLARGEAKVILNEVNSSDPSILKGYVEVAGKKADVIIANPSGLHCKGCGIINSDRATFTTGKPQIKNGHLDSLVVEKGKVKVSGKGLDNSRVDYTEIIARETQANAGIWSKKETKVITGKNTVKRSDTPSDLQIIHTKQPLETETQPQFAIDVGELGGMYSGKIHLIGTEQGVGVRNAGHIGASAENLNIDSQGRIINTGTINAQQEIQLTGNQGIENKGKIENRQGHIQLSTPATIKQDGSIVARGGHIHQTANQAIHQQGETVAQGHITYRASSVSASTSSLIASGVNVKDTAQGEVRTLEDFSAQGKSINIATIGKTTLQGKNLSSGRLNISSLEANLDHSHTSADAIKVNVSQGKIQANNATMIANTELTLTTPTLLETQHSGFKAEKINTTQRSLNTKGATWEQTGTEALKLEVADKLQNSQGTFKTQGDFTVNAQGMDNQQGRLIAKGKLTVTTRHSKLDSTQGLLAAEKGVVINSGELINDGGLIQSSQNVTINTQGQKLSNQQTFTDSQDKGIVALGSIDIQSGHLENQQGVITTRESLHLTAGTVHNDHGVMGARNLTAHLTNLYQQSGTVQAAQLLNIVASGEISSKNRSQVSGDSIAITLTGQLDNQQSEIIARQDAVIHSGQLNNNDATLVTEQGNFEINTKQQRFTNQQGKLSAGANLTIQSGELDNQQGLIQSHQAMLINTHQANLNNEKGQVKAKETLSLKANAINNREGQVRATEGTLSLSAVSTLDNTLGYITAKQQAALEANALNNQRGVVYNEQDLLHLNVKQTLDNSEGKVISKDALTMASASLTNQQGTLYAENQGNLSVNGLLDNQHLGKIYGLGEMAIQANQIDNRGGEIRTQHKLVLNATADINNQKVSDTGSFIESGNVLSIHTEQLNNSQTKSTNEKMTQGILASAIALSAQMVDNQQGKIHSRTQGNLQIQTHLTNHQGEITGDGNLTIQGKALSLNNQEGRLQAADSLSLFANEVTTNGHIEGRDIAITQQKDFVTNNHINANQRLSINTAGHLTNQHNLYADEQVILNANHITNRIDGRISSANTQITAKGDFTNEGLINGVSIDDRANTVIKVGGRLTNTGKGRIYGDDIALQADSIENSDKDYGGSEILSAVVAARGNLDLAAREIENNTAYYLSDNQVGATLFSVGDMTFGRTLNANNQAEGKADVLRNNSSVIESESRIRFGVDKVYNNNTHFTAAHVKNGEKVTEITKVSENPLNETYIIPMHRDSRGNLPTYYKNDKGDNFSQMTSEYKHIPMELLRWVGWSRAGQLVYNLNNIEPTVLSAGETIRPDMLLASRNQMRCDSYSDGTKNCTYIPAGNHELDSPIWTYAGVSAPSRPSPIFSFDELASQGYKEEDWFSLDPKTNELDIFKIPEEPGVAPEIPVRLENESEVDFQARMTRYQQALETYTQAQKKWDYYQNRIKPYNDWVDEHKEILDAVDKKIEEHNQNLSTTLGQQYFREFWQINLKNRREDESKVLTTVAGQIIAGRNLEVNSQSFINDRSVVIAGQDMLLENKIENIDEEGLHRITDTGHKVFTFDKWRGGLKRYFQRKWENAGNYTRIIETPFDMHIFRMEENVDYTANKQISNNLKARTEHQLSLSKVSVNNDTLSSINELRTVNTQLDTHHALRDTTLNSLTTQTTVKDSRTLERVTLSEHQEVRSIQPNLVIPQNVLYRVNANPTNSVLIETDPDFTNQKRWLSSDYMFNALRYEPNQVQKRLGDGFYEQRLVREQINRLTGRNFVGDYTDFDNQYRGLMDAGVTFAQKFNLRPGIALSSEQVAQLTADIVWLESESITLPNGKVENVLVPKVYALAKKGDITGNGALLSGNKVTHKEGEFINSGKVAGRELVQFDSESIRNSGNISGGGIVGDVRGDMENVGGTIEAERAILLNVAGNFNHSSQTHTTAVNEQGYQRTDTTIGRKGLLYVKGENGTLQIQANNIHLAGADIINDGQGQTYLSAKNNLNLTALSVGFDEKMGGGNHYRNEAVQSVEVSRVQGKGDVVLSGQNIYSEAAQLEAKQHLALLAENDVVLGTASTSSDYAEYHHTKSGGALGSSKKTTLDTYQDKTQVGTTLGGGDILVSAGNDLKVKNLQAIADKDLHLQAVNNVSISADTNYFKDTHFEQKSKSGVFSGGGIGITFGKKSETHESEAEGWQQSQARSTLGSLSGNVSVKAGNHAHLSGTDLIASKELGKAITIEGKSTYIGASQDELSSKERHEYKQSGLTIAFSSAVTDAAMAVQSSLKRSEQVKDERLSQLLKVKAANEAAETVQKASKAIDAIQKAGSVSEGLANSDAKISVSIGASKSVSTSHTKQTTHQGSELSAGAVTVRATEGDNTIVGSKVDAKEVALEGKNINLLGTTDTQSNRSDNKSSSWSVGVFVGKSGGSTGLGIEGAVSIGKGHSNSDSQVQNHTEINTDRLTIKANETTALKGATANINHLALDTKNLHIESVQDVEKYDSKQTQGGVSASVAIYGSGSSVSAQFSRNKANVDYAQVNQQSGFNINESSDINVEENTHLKGGVINAQGDKANHSLKTGTLTTESIENRSDIKVSSVSAGVSSDMTQMATMAVGAALSALGNTNESERSQTQAAISQNVNVQITDSEKQKSLTGKTAEETLQSLNRDVANANQKLEKQDLQAIQESQEATQIVAEMGAKAVGDLAKMMNWEEGSPQKIALHGLIGYLSAKVGGGNTTASTLSAMGSEYINSEIANYLQQNTVLTADQRNAIQQASAAGLGALIGASLGGDSNTVNQTAQMAWRTEKFNRQLHPDEMKWIKAHAKEFAEQEGLTVEEAEKRLSQQAAKGIDILWFLMLDDKVDTSAQAFLSKQSRKTFMDSQGNVQHYFVAKDNDFFESRKYASEANTYNQQQGDKFIERNLQSGVIRSAKDGFEDKVSNVYEKVKEAPSETGKAVAENIWMSVKECGKAPIDCVADVVSNMLMTGKSAVSETYHNIKGTEQADVSTLYGKDVSDEMLMVSGLQLTGSVTEILGAGKVAKVGGEAVVDGAVSLGKATISNTKVKLLDSSEIGKITTNGELKNDVNKALPENYSYISDTEVKGPNGGVYTLVGQDIDGNPIYQSKSGGYVSFESNKRESINGYSQRPEKSVDELYDRSYLRKDTLEKIYANYEKLPNGDYLDLDGNIIKGPIDIGHMYGWEHRRLSLAAKELGLSQQDLNNYINSRPEMFRLENMSENRSHRNEMPGNGDIIEIKQDMQKFMNGDK